MPAAKDRTTADELVDFGMRRKWRAKLLDASRACAAQARDDSRAFDAAYDAGAFARDAAATAAAAGQSRIPSEEVLTAQFSDRLAAYWSPSVLDANLFIVLHLMGALALGLVVGYERSYHGRAAGMRTYGLVCMASAALVVIAGYPAAWFGGHAAPVGSVDPTRVVQGIVTGIGFLGAGVIVKEGFSISGLNTAASIWASSAIGVLVGLGFYTAAMAMAVLAAVCMSVISRLEQRLPAHSGVAVMVRYQKGYSADEDVLCKASLDHGYEIGRGSMSIKVVDGQAEWRFIAIARDRRRGASVSDLAQTMSLTAGIDSFSVSPTRQ